MTPNTRPRPLVRTGLLALLLGVMLSLGGLIPGTASAAEVAATLHPAHVGATNPGFSEGECPAPPGSATWGWHFVLSGADDAFVSISATFQNAGVITDFISEPTAKHAYVYTPGPDTLLGATAVVEGTDTVFNLSHVCGGTEPTNGWIEVTKVISGETDGYVAGSEFGFSIDCDDDTFDGTFTLVAGETTAIQNVPLGTVCTVTETDVPAAADGYSYEAAVLDPVDGTVTVTSTTEPVTVTVTNPLAAISPNSVSPTSLSPADVEAAAAANVATPRFTG
jgi:hypothetical protein